MIIIDFATIQKPQAETNQYQDVHELTTGSPVIVTSHRLKHEEDPYHVTRSEVILIHLFIPQCELALLVIKLLTLFILLCSFLPMVTPILQLMLRYVLSL